MKQDYKPSPRQNTHQKFSKSHANSQNLSSSHTPSSQQVSFIKNIINKKWGTLTSIGVLATAVAFSLIFTFEKQHQAQLAQKASQPVQITLAIPATNNAT